MRRQTFMTAACAVVLSALMLPTTRAEELADPFAAELSAPPAPAPAISDAGSQAASTPSLYEVPPVTRNPTFLRQVGMMQQGLRRLLHSSQVTFNSVLLCTLRLVPIFRSGRDRP
jgi:hypothetical protein